MPGEDRIIPSGYQIVPGEVVAVSKVLSDMWIRLGRPTTPFSKSGGKLMDILIATWEDLYPDESRKWTLMRANYKKVEKTTRQQVKQRTGRSLASYPMYIFQVMKKLFPTFNPAERKNCMKMVRKWPMFQMCQKV